MGEELEEGLDEEEGSSDEESDDEAGAPPPAAGSGGPIHVRPAAVCRRQLPCRVVPGKHRTTRLVWCCVCHCLACHHRGLLLMGAGLTHRGS